jgi:predicted nucleic acid-binding protein
MRRAAVIDSSVLINLTHLELASKLSLYFDVIYVPRRVQEEVNKKARFRRRLNKLYVGGIFQRCACADEYRVRILTSDRLDAGEAEGLVQAQEKGARFFIADERRARATCERQGLTPVGTVRLIARLCLEGYAPETRSLVDKLRRDQGFRVAEGVVNRAIEDALTPI